MAIVALQLFIPRTTPTLSSVGHQLSGPIPNRFAALLIEPKLFAVSYVWTYRFLHAALSRLGVTANA